MKCPSCGKEVANDKSFCDFCGFSLYGPRNISLNNPTGNTNSVQSNNIQSITGIDINSISNEVIKEATKVTPPKEKKSVDKNKIILFIMAIIIAILSIICIFLFINKDDGENNCQNTTNQINNTTPNNNTIVSNNTTYALTSNYSFVLPNDFIYTQDAQSTIVSNGDTSIIMYNNEEGKIDKATGDTIKKQYIALGYSDANVVENTLNSKKIIYISFTSNNLFFKDFYYQYDSNKYIYGQISASSSAKLSTENINTILSSLKIEASKNVSVNKATINYENILLLFK